MNLLVMSAAGPDLFQRFLTSGFARLVNTEPEELADYLEDRAAAGGGVALLFVSEAIRTAYGFFLEHDEGGGIRSGFRHQLDTLVRDRLPAIEQSQDESWAAELARDFRDEVTKRISSYDAGLTYE